MMIRHLLCSVFLSFSLMMIPVSGHADEKPSGTGRPFRLVRAVMCESIERYEPRYVSVAFSAQAGKISCFTLFDGVTETTFVEHRWFRRDELVTSKRLTIKTPRWATFSSIQMREGDKGPWRVEIWDSENQLIKTLRFSVTD
jgi:hypothetical protein